VIESPLRIKNLCQTCKVLYFLNILGRKIKFYYQPIHIYIYIIVVLTTTHKCIEIILIIKPTRCINFSNLFWKRTLHISDSFSVHHQKSSTVHTAIGICHTGYADCLTASSRHNLYDIYLLLCVQC
jgi:hypothetical protein